MARTTRQTAIFGVEDWKRIYETFREADFQSYDFETLRKSFIDYLRQYYPETFNDYIESSEFIALLDVIAFMGQAMAFRNDLNTRENYLDTAERRDSVVRLANLVGYTPKRNNAAQGYLKVFSVQTTENVTDLNGVNLSNLTVNWNDPTNQNWQEQFTAIVNAALVDSQRIGRPGNRQNILNVTTDEYTVNLTQGFLPIISFNATVDNVNMPFEVVSATSVGKDFVYEQPPRPDGGFNLLFRNDRLGFGSPNTGYFFYFKQGVLQTQDFNLDESVTNRTVPINIEGINNEDHWVFQINNGELEQWNGVDNVLAGAVEQLDPDQRKIYSVTSRSNDQITLVFGDGVFSAIPVGLFRCFARASNGLRYTISPDDMQSVSVPISYISRFGQLETITFTCGITQPVTNAQPRETLDEIKQRAPARYYTQNRMVNGEDYNNFPFTKYNSIIKSKAVNRSSIGTSRYLDLVDVTAKYSSTNSFASDGALWKEDGSVTFSFPWLSRTDIEDVITNRIEPILITPPFVQFYYNEDNFSRPSLTSLNLTWNQSTAAVNNTTGFFRNSSGVPVPVGSFSSSNTKYIVVGSLIKFVPPGPDKFFDANNRIASGVPSQPGEKTELWVSPVSIISDGTAGGQGNLRNGTGPVALNSFVPTGAVPVQVIPILVSNLPSSIRNSIINEITLNRTFGLDYDNLTTTWQLVQDPVANSEYGSASNAGNTKWVILFTPDGEKYTVTIRGLNYNFGSVLETRFFFETGQKIFDSRTGRTVSDFIKVLRTNSKPNSAEPLDTDYELKILGQPAESDGFVNDYQVLVGFQDSDADGIADDPDFFNSIVDLSKPLNEKLVFFQRVIDFDNLQRLLLAEPNKVNSEFPHVDDIEQVKTEFFPGQIFYAFVEGKFYELFKDSTDQLVLIDQTNNWVAKIGRQSLYFQYRHNAPLTARIDPGTTNIIDLYVVTQEYYTAYLDWIRDTTNTVPAPAVPTVDQLSTDYQALNDFKMISDNIIVDSVRFKPLFGAKAPLELQATIKVIRASGSTASDSEIKNRVINNVNEYFTIDKWDFGSTFFFSELAAFIHQRMGGIVSSVVLVPTNPNKRFGDLYEVRCAPNEIFVSAATVTDVEVISALTSTNIKTAQGSGVI
jgi:hypothetical protein